MKSIRRKICIITSNRADYSICLPILKEINKRSSIELQIMVTGMHLSPEFGKTIDLIESDGFTISEKVEMLVSSDSPEGISKSIGLGVIGFAQVFSKNRPDILVVLADRYEMYASALAALPFQLPLAHIEGGDLTLGAFDDSLRHSITKFSHLHFVSTFEYKKRVIQLGEEPWRVLVSGAPSLDTLKNYKAPSKKILEEKYKIPLSIPPLLITFHPVTKEFENVEYQINELLKAVKKIHLPKIFTRPNADTGGRVIAEAIRKFITCNDNTYLIDNFGSYDYLGMLHYSCALVGNSSSGIIEAPTLRLPVVNIGTRQRGRIQARNVINVEYSHSEIISGIKHAISNTFIKSLNGMKNPYGNGKAAQIIVDKLEMIKIDKKLLSKEFFDL